MVSKGQKAAKMLVKIETAAIYGMPVQGAPHETEIPYPEE
jgi:hypothetical protein